MSGPHFQAGGTLPPNAPSYIERDADRELIEALGRSEYVFVLDSRQIGKSSLIARATIGLRDHGIRVVNLDLTRFGSSGTIDQWYYSILKQIGESLGSWPQMQKRYKTTLDETPASRFFSALAEEILNTERAKLVIFVDEVDAVLNLSFNADEFFSGIRELFTRRAQDVSLEKVCFCLVGSATPGALIESATSTPFNIGRQVKLADFSKEELRAFSSRFDIEMSTVDQVYKWTSGHPYLSQKLCSEFVRLRGQGEISVDEITRRLYLQEEAGDAEHLAHVTKRILGSKEFRLNTKDMLRALRRVRSAFPPGNDPGSPVQNILRISGLAKVQRGQLVSRNLIYYNVFGPKWISELLPTPITKYVKKMRVLSGLAVGTSAIVILITTGVATRVLLSVHVLDILTIRIPARSGAIVDRNGVPLASSNPISHLTVGARRAPTDNKFWEALAEASNIDEGELKRQTSRKTDWEFNRELSESEVSSIRQVQKRWKADGIGIMRIDRRTYWCGEAMAPVVGEYKDNRGYGGDWAWRELLAGKDGRAESVILRRPIGGSEGYSVLSSDRHAPVDGKDIELTIDSAIQQAAYASIKSAVQANKADFGSAIILDVATGDILGMASYPSISPGMNPSSQITESGSIVSPEANYAVAGTIAPGGLIRPVVYALALEDGLVRPGEQLQCTGDLYAGKSYRIHDQPGFLAHGLISFEVGLSNSCNVAAALCATKLGYSRLVSGLESFGVFRKPIEFPNARKAQFHRDVYAEKLQVATVGIGQSIEASPLTWASCIATLANGGTLIVPRLIRRVGGRTEIVKRYSSVVKPWVAMHVLDALRQKDTATDRVLRGQAHGVSFFGKTATVQSAKGQVYTASYVGLMPENKPEIVILVSVVHPKSGQIYGAIVAGPAVAETARYISKKRDIGRAGQ